MLKTMVLYFSDLQKNFVYKTFYLLNGNQLFCFALDIIDYHNLILHVFPCYICFVPLALRLNDCHV